MKNLRNILFWSIFIIIIGLFCYFRLKPIFFQTIPYTYDQGRDFLKAREIIHDKHIPFIGPTTGIQGVFHGAWWYYYLAIPHLIFQGNPSGFPLFTFLTFLGACILFTLFLKREFGEVPALFFAIVTAVTSYFIGISFFVTSSFPLLPLFLLLFYSTYRYLKGKAPLFLFLIFLTLGMIFEVEVAAGLMIIPAFLLTSLVTKNLRRFWPNMRSLLLSLVGLLITFVPRILFELKNNFLQSRAFISFFLHPTQTHVTTLKGAVLDRVGLFWHYYLSLFNDSLFLALGIAAISFSGLIYGYKKFTALQRKYLLFFSTFLASLFLVSLAYRNNFFWANYFEGLPLIYLLLLIFGIYGLGKSKIKYLNTVPILIFVIIFILGIIKGYGDFRLGAPKEIGGMREQILAAEYLYKNVGKNDFCARIYTPPVIPHTYNYLFSYYSDQKKFKFPKSDFVNDSCWYIIEKEPYAFRIEKWRKENIPTKAKIVKKKVISNNVMIEFWELTNER